MFFWVPGFRVAICACKSELRKRLTGDSMLPHAIVRRRPVGVFDVLDVLDDAINVCLSISSCRRATIIAHHYYHKYILFILILGINSLIAMFSASCYVVLLLNTVVTTGIIEAINSVLSIL